MLAQRVSLIWTFNLPELISGPEIVVKNRQKSRRQAESARLLLLGGFRHPSEKSEFITTHKIICPERRKGREWSERGKMNSHLELVSSQQPSPLSNPR